MNKKVFGTFRRLQKPDAGSFWLSIFISIMAPLLGSVIAPLYYAKMTNMIAKGDAISLIKTAAFMYCAIVLTKTIIWRIGNWLLIIIQQRTIHRIAEYTAYHLLGLSMDFFKDHSTGAIVGKHNKFNRGYERMYDEYFFNLIPSAIIFVCIMPVLFIKMPLFGSGMIVLGLLFVFMTYKFAVWAKPYNDTYSSSDTKVTSLLSDQVSNISTIHSFGIIEEEQKLYSKLNEQRSEKRKIAWLRGFVHWTANDIFSIAMTLASVWIAIYFWEIGKFSLGDVILVISYTDTLGQRLANMGNVIKNVNQLNADAEEMIEILDTRPTVLDNGTQTLPYECGDIKFSNMHFAYHESKPLFQDFNLTIKAGEKIGIVGETGSGKSTLIKLLTREMDITGGLLTIHDKPIADIKLRSLRRHTSLVPQSPILFHRSIKDNIKIGRTKASMEEVITAAKKAKAHDFIIETVTEKGTGYDARVGERGIKLSGGQIQRIAIARAFLANRPVFIFDEATSALDSKSEGLIQKSLEETLKENYTMICIAHRLSTVAKLDRIIVLEKGRIVESGSHTELLVQNGIYADLWKKQLLLDDETTISDENEADESPESDDSDEKVHIADTDKDLLQKKQLDEGIDWSKIILLDFPGGFFIFLNIVAILFLKLTYD